MAISAIITADIVNSTKLSPAEQKSLNTLLIAIIGGHKYEFYRGDSYQVYVKDPALALLVVLQTRAAARKVSMDCDIRSSIGIGEVNPHMRKLSSATGEAFVLSGRAFDRISKGDERLVIDTTAVSAKPAVRIISLFVDYLFGKMTSKQAEVITNVLAGRTQAGAATKLKKSQSTINRHLHAAGWNEISKLLSEYELAVREQPE